MCNGRTTPTHWRRKTITSDFLGGTTSLFQVYSDRLWVDWSHNVNAAVLSKESECDRTILSHIISICTENLKFAIKTLLCDHRIQQFESFGKFQLQMKLQKIKCSTKELMYCFVQSYRVSCFNDATKLNACSSTSTCHVSALESKLVG